MNILSFAIIAGGWICLLLSKPDSATIGFFAIITAGLLWGISVGMQ